MDPATNRERLARLREMNSAERTVERLTDQLAEAQETLDTLMEDYDAWLDENCPEG